MTDTHDQDSLTKIIGDCKIRRGELTGMPHSEREVMALNYLIDRLEALRANPVAWMKEEGSYVQRQESAILGYTIPLIRGD